MNRSIFLFSFSVWSSCSSSTSDFVWTAALRSKLPILSVGSKVYPFLPCGYCLTWSSIYDVCLYMDFQVTRSRWGIVVCSVCLYFNSFIFLGNLMLRPQVIVIKLEQTHTEHRPQLPAALMHVTPVRTRAYHKSIAPTIWCPSDERRLIQSLIDPLASSQYSRSPRWCFLQFLFLLISLSDVDFELLLLTNGASSFAVLWFYFLI